MTTMTEQTRPFRGSPTCHNVHDPAIRKSSRRKTSTTKSQSFRTSEPCSSERLSMWNQYSPRVYIGLALCFPFEGTDQASLLRAERHIRKSLDRLGEARPDFSAKLTVGTDGYASLQRCPKFKIPLDVISDDKHSTEQHNDAYETHKKSGFAPGLFIDKSLVSDGALGAEEGVPASKVSLKFVNGGLYLLIHIHHSLFDGCSMGIFLDCFAAQTRSENVDYLNHPTQQLLPGLEDGANGDRHVQKSNPLRDQIFESSVARCPEYTILHDKSGPTQPKLEHGAVPMSEIRRTGKVFVFRNDRLQKLRETIQHELQLTKLPTSYTVLSALAWAHIVQARNGHENYLSGEQCNANGQAQIYDRTSNEGSGKESSLWNSVNWRPRANKEEAKEYFGNAVLPVVTRLPLKNVLSACRSTKDLAKFVIPHVRATITSVNQEYVNKREDMMRAAPDPRMIGVNYDPRMREMVHFNTWRHFGASTEWAIPGVPVSRAEAIRRVHGDWNLGTALILPAPAGSEIQELFVSLSTAAMEALCNDKEWLEWVDRVVD